jgi:hypothetical protein
VAIMACHPAGHEARGKERSIKGIAQNALC